MRLFLAIDLSDEIKQRLTEQLSVLHKQHPDLNWVSEHNYHITLQFFGDSIQVEKVKKAIEEIIFDIPVVQMYSLKVDIFIKDKITLYIEMRREKNIEGLVHQLRDKLQLKHKENFIPHITIGRYKIPSKQQYLHLKKKLQNLDVDLEFEVKELTLFDSNVNGRVPVYTVVEKFQLVEE